MLLVQTTPSTVTGFVSAQSVSTPLPNPSSNGFESPSASPGNVASSASCDAGHATGVAVGDSRGSGGAGVSAAAPSGSAATV